MSNAVDRGFVVGQSYEYRSKDTGLSDLNGKLLRFKSDDGSRAPAFEVPLDVDSDGWMYLSLDNFIATPVAIAGVTFDVSVNGSFTTVSIGKALSASQVAAVLAAAGL